MKGFTRTTALTLLASTFVSATPADETEAICDNCSESSYENTAKYAVGPGYHTVHVFDTVKFTVNTFSVSVEQEGPTWMRFAIKQPSPQNKIDGMADFEELYLEFQVPINLRPWELGEGSNYGSVYDVAGDPYALIDLRDRFLVHHAILGNYANI